MTIDELLSQLKPGAELSVMNEPFLYVGQAECTLESGEKIYWLYEDGGGLLAVAPMDEEIVHYELLEEELEPHSDVFLFRNKEYFLSYEGAGTVTASPDGADAEVGDQFTLTDYESDDGAIIARLNNATTGEEKLYHGRIVVEEEIRLVQ